MADVAVAKRKGINDVFYETRALMGRDYTIRRFATEVLGGIHPVALGYIEKGERLPSEKLVRRIAELRKEDPQELLALLYRDRMIHGFAKELRRVLRARQGMTGIEDADLTAVTFKAIATLPEEGEWMALEDWRTAFSAIPRRRGRPSRAPAALVKQVEETLLERELIEVRGEEVRRHGYHYVAQSSQERQAMALDFCALFAKGILDKLALPGTDTGTYLRNHYLHVNKENLPQFQRELDEALVKLADKYATDESARTRFLNVLVTSTPL